MASGLDVANTALAERTEIGGRPLSNSTSDNKYCSWYGMNGYWCAMFVSYVCNKAGVSEDVVPKFAYCPDCIVWARKKGRLHSKSEIINGTYVPQQGDIFLRDGHTGIIVSVSGNELTTVEGNTGGNGPGARTVASHTWTFSGGNYEYIFNPNYPEKINNITYIRKSIPVTGTIQGVPYGQNTDQLFNNDRYGVYKDLFEKYGKQYNVDPNLLAAIAMQESSLTDVSTGPAQGVMQIEYVLLDENEGYPNGWLSFAAYGRKVYGTAWTSSDRVDANKCIEYAAYVIDQGLKYYNGDLLKAVQQYNYSHYTVDELIRKYGDNWFTTGRASKAGYGDGQYVEHVFRYWLPNSLDGRYANPSLEEYAYSENSYAAEGEEQTVIWNNRVKENIQPRLNGITNIIPQNNELCIYVENNNISSYVGNLSWQNNISELATTLSFETPKTDAKYISNLIYIPKCGDVLRMVTDREVFRGVVISVDDGDKEVNQYTAVDMGWYMNKTSQTYQFKNITADEAIRQICDDLSIPINILTELTTVINQIYFDKTISDIIKDILGKCSGNIFYDMVPEGLRIYRLGYFIAEPVFTIAKNIKTVKSSDISGNVSHALSIEDMKNSIKITSQQDNVYTEISVLQDRDSINKYGFLQEIIQIDPEKEDANIIANDTLFEKNKESETYSFEIMENINSYTRAGEIIKIDDFDYLIESTSHRISQGIHYNKIELRKIVG